MSSKSSRAYVAITADTHGGASLDAYREHLDAGWRDEFDAWRSAYRNPAKRHIDYPHSEGCHPYSRENMRLAFAGVDEAEVRRMLGENAAALYGFDLEALRPIAERIGITPEAVRVPLDEIPADSACPTFQRERFLRQRARA